MDPYAAADIRHDRDSCEFDARTDWLETQSAEIYKDWKYELKLMGYIEDIDLEEADLIILAAESGKSVDDYLKDAAYQWAVDYELELKARVISEPNLNWR